jgi:phosphatidylglycerophosphate synthase
VIEYTRWSRANALVIVLTTAVTLWAKLPALLGVVGASSFAWLLYRLRAHWTPQGGFGLPNAITTLRLVLTSGLLFGGLLIPAWVLVLVALAVVTLDGVDGWAARRFGSQSEFGARYDTAVDSLFTLALSVLLLGREVLGGWVMIAGFWHYAFVLWAWVFPSARESERSLFAACIFVALVSTMGVAFLLPPPVATPLVALAVILQSASFARSLWQQYGPV